MNWLTSLQLDIIDSWDDLKNMFIKNYKANYEWVAMKHDLVRVYQRAGELLRPYICCFLEVRNRIPNILETMVITCFV